MAFFVAYVFVLCFLEGLGVNGIASAAIPSIEKQYKLSSTKSALISSGYDIGALCVVLFISFIGSRYHKPRLIVAGSVIMAIGSLLFMVPHFAEEYTYTESSTESSSTRLCNGTTSSTEEVPSTCESGDSKYLLVFVLAQAFHGVGFSPMFTLGTVYIDENEAHNLASLYIGLTYAAAGLGVATGFFIGGQFIGKLFIDFDRKSVDFDSSDPRWVGAWWCGFIITAVGFLLVAIPISCFPKALPDTEKYKQANDVDMVQDKQSASILTRVVFNFKSFSKALLRLLRGLILFGSFGMFLGGLLVRIFNLSLVGMLRLSSLSMILSAILGLSYLAGCPEVPLVGMEIPYGGKSTITLKDDCHASCFCETQSYFPICGSDDKVYYSPCHAGCSSLNMGSYENCSCVEDSFNSTTIPSLSAVSGKCQYDCTNIYIWAPCLFLANIFLLTSVTPSSMATLRCVEKRDKALAVGMVWVFLRVLGTIPGPVLIGWALDQSCLLWSSSTCMSASFCQLYSNSDMSVTVMTWWIVVCTLGAMFFFISSCFAMKYKHIYDLREEQSQDATRTAISE